MVQLGAVRCKLVQLGASCWSLVYGGAVWCKVLQLGALCCKGVKLGATWCSLVQVGGLWCKVVRLGASWCSLVQGGAFWYKLVQGGETKIDDIAQEQTIICRQLFAGHVVGSRPMKRKKIEKKVFPPFFVFPLSGGGCGYT